MKKQFITIITIIVMLSTFFQVESIAQDSQNGKCGENVYWAFDASTATLSITGVGEMTEFNPILDNAPWKSYQEDIQHLVVADGVTGFSGGSIVGLESLKTITFPQSLSGKISYFSLYGFPALTDVFFAGNIVEFYALLGNYPDLPENVTIHYGEDSLDPTPSADVFYTETLPKSIKIGDPMPKADITFHNLTPGIEYHTYISDFTGENESDPVFYLHPYDRSEGHSSVVDTDGTIKNQELASDEQVNGVYAYRPGYWKLVPQISAKQPPYGSWQIGNAIFVEVESPIITHTAPTAAVVGQTIQLNTSLTNVNLKNYKVSDYENVEPIVCWTDEYWDGENTLIQTHRYHRFGNLHPIAYKPTVEVISGSDLIERKNKDYSNTLNSTESITFLKEGTIKLRISYNQIKTMDCAAECFDYNEIVTIQINREHVYTNDCDTTCNICEAMRSITHKYGNYIYNNDATAVKDGTKTRTCSVCGEKESITAVGTKRTNPFKDVKASEYFYTPVLWAVANNITTGTSATTFEPDVACTRGQIVTFLWRSAGSPALKESNNPFNDVKDDQYYYSAVLWAVENGITTGTSATTFEPDADCTRGQIVTFLWRAAGSPTPKGGNNPFNDVKSNQYYYKAVLWAVENGITTGTSATTFEPDVACTRGQIVTFLYRHYN